MSYFENKSLYWDWITGFLEGRTAAPEFKKRFTKQWERDRDEQLACRGSWVRRFDLELDEALKNHQITAEEYGQKYLALFGVDTEAKRLFLEFLDKLYSACDCYYEDDEGGPIEEYEYTATQLREFVAGQFRDYEHGSQLSPDAEPGRCTPMRVVNGRGSSAR